MTHEQGVRERLKAYIYPRSPTTEDEAAALEEAVLAQIAFEEDSGMVEAPGGVSSYTLGDLTVQLSERWPAYTRETISPTAWAILRNAGLVRHALPTARRV